MEGEDRPLIDPNGLNPDGTTALDWYHLKAGRGGGGGGARRRGGAVRISPVRSIGADPSPSTPSRTNRMGWFSAPVPILISNSGRPPAPVPPGLPMASSSSNRARRAGLTRTAAGYDVVRAFCAAVQRLRSARLPPASGTGRRCARRAAPRPRRLAGSPARRLHIEKFNRWNS